MVINMTHALAENTLVEHTYTQSQHRVLQAFEIDTGEIFYEVIGCQDGLVRVYRDEVLSAVASALKKYAT
ncbi:hypothetical protein LA66_14000 [Aureimonas altamirensis]|uniref:Uncharacterized protein n=1 Tax=Aureimonas altamirensis TaxID=370622 RepID=A0A0B1Q2E8_9HYPH|nr:hypothetical protein LA66_14000 [Aureimonas altamirensis]